MKVPEHPPPDATGAFFDLTADRFPVGLFATDAVGGRLRVNARWRAYAGVGPEWAPRSGWWEVVAPEDRERVRAGWEAALGSGAPFSAEFRLSRDDGEACWVQVEARHTPGDGYSGTMVDVTDRKRHELMLQEAEHLAHLGSWELNFETGRSSWSAEVYRIFGLPPTGEPVTFASFLDRIHPDDRARVEAAWQSRRQAAAPLTHAYRILMPDGSERVLESHSLTVTDRSGRPVKAYGTVLDITERRRLQAELQDERDKLRAIVDHTTDAIFILDHEGRYIFANRAAAENLKLTLDQVIGRTNADLFDAETLARLYHPRQEALTGPITQELQLTTCGGYSGYFSITLYPYHAHSGERLGMIGIARDVTARMHEQNELRRTVALLKAQNEAALDGILAVDERNLIIGRNPQFLKIWEVPPEIASQSDDAPLLAHVTRQVQDPEAFLDRVRYLYAHPFETSRDLLHLRDGRVLDRYSSPIVSPEGTSFGRVWFFRDVTDRYRLEEQLRERYEALQTLDRLKNNFVNGVSHDLRTPLTSIQGYAEFLEDEIGGPLADQQREFVAQILQSSKRLERLVDDLLDFARLDAGTFRLERHPTDFGRLVKEVADSLRPQFREARLALRLELSEAPICIEIDATRIERVLINLLSNAIKFTPPGGSITIRTALHDHQLRCEVSDTGVGIPPEDLPKLFRRFSQLERGKFKGGTGLGLSISRALIEAHGGAIGVESAPDTGSTFWFVLPMSAPLTEPRVTPVG